MGDREQPDIWVSMGDVDRSQVAVGTNITQTGAVEGRGSAASEEDLAALRTLLAELVRRVEAEAPVGERAGAVERVGELEEALVAEVPDVTTIHYVRNWFAKHVPQLVGSVVGVLVNPAVGAVLAAAGGGISERVRQLLDDS